LSASPEFYIITEKEQLLRNGFYPEDKERKPFFRNRAAGLGVSLILHAFFIYGLYRTGLTLKILAVRPDVKNVLLVPPVRITVPSPIDKYIQGIPGGDIAGPEGGKPGGRSETDRDKSGSGDAAGAGAGTARGGVEDNRPESASPAAILGKNLTLRPSSYKADDGRLRIDLSAIPDHIEDAPLGFEGGKPRRYSPLLKYVRPGTGGSGPGGGGPPGAGVGGGQRARVSIQSPGYDISPWARRAMEFVQAHWRIPETPRIGARSEVRIAVTVEKDGTLSSLKILESADLEVLNTASMKALGAGVPFPSLPEDFPRSSLEALFVFSYHE
jgi:hypothetical protein